MLNDLIVSSSSLHLKLYTIGSQPFGFRASYHTTVRDHTHAHHYTIQECLIID